MTRISQAEFAPVAASVRGARQLVTNVLGATLLETPEFLDLFVSEVVTNAVLHGRTQFTVRAETNDEVVRVSVIDHCPVLPSVSSAAPEAIHGRGLKLVADFARDWGCEPTSSGKTVWFELGVATATS